ncbi:S8 family serine peptidase [Robbsia sp. KACC 23696]|uniref:S8 family serine peptidase n=1 Tax=Robbsia sp. KACC 23696 TaxID=3149231 RepID=UPI00325B7660
MQNDKEAPAKQGDAAEQERINGLAQKAREEAARLVEQRKAQEEQDRQTEQRKAQEEQERLAALRKAQEEQDRQTEQRKAQEEQERLAAQQKAQEEQERLAALRKAQEEVDRLAALQKAKDEAARVALQDQQERERRINVAAKTLSDRSKETTLALADDMLKKHDTGEIGTRLRAASAQAQQIQTELHSKDVVKDEALLLRIQNAKQTLATLLDERRKWIADAPARDEQKRLKVQQEQEAREAQKAREAEEARAKARREADERRRQLLAKQEPDFCNPASVMTYASGAAEDPSQALTQITITLQPQGQNDDAEGNRVRVDAVLKRALKMHADGARDGDLGGALMLTRAIDQQAVKIDRFLPDGSAVITLGQRVPSREVQRLLDYIVSDPDVFAADPDSEIVEHYITADPGTGASVDDPRWHLTRIKADAALALLPDDAARQAVATAVIDSGWVKHRSLTASRYEGGANFSAMRKTSPTAQQFRNVGLIDPSGNSDVDDFFHGTGVAGFIGASTTPSIPGITANGVNPGSRLLPVMMGTMGLLMHKDMASDMSEAIYWVAGKPVPSYGPQMVKVRVINISLGRPTNDPRSRVLVACPAPLQQAITYANAQGISVVTSAGNNDSPASWSIPGNCDGVIVVGGTDVNDRRFLRPQRKYAGSAYGKAVTISAPADDVWSVTIDSAFTVNGRVASRTPIDGTEFQTKVIGTSFSSPQVAGVISLMLAANPTLRPDEIKTILTDSANKTMQDLPDICQRPPGAGILDAEAAVKRARNGTAG